MQNLGKITHCIFDFDGTLIDSERYLTKAANQVVQRYGKEFTWNLKSKTLGLHFGLSGPIVIQELDLPLTLEEYIKEVLDEYGELIIDCPFMPGAKRLVKHLYDHHIPMAICTGSTQQTFKLKNKNFGDFFEEGKYFNHIVKAGDDPQVKRNKPFPDPYIVSVARFSPKPDIENVLVFEDSPTGVTSAITAGLKCVMIPDPRLDKSLLNQATLVIDSLNDFKPELFGLPSF